MKDHLYSPILTGQKSSCKSFFINRIITSIFVILIFSISTGFIFAQTPVGFNGKLSISGSSLVNKNNEAIQLRGMSSHGPQWYSDCYTFNSLNSLTNDWGIDIFRIAMYVEENGYVTNPTYWRNWIDDMVDLCGQFGIYCMIDWHVLTPGDPNTNLNEAKEFWGYMSQKHSGKDHVIYEICNEPNGVTWDEVKNYANEIIPIIRANDPSTIIVVGTPSWCQEVDKPAQDPLVGNNLMYSLHFYSGTHGSWLLDRAAAALDAGIALFVTEFGTSQASGDDGPYLAETDVWMNFMQTRKISWCNWSFSDKSEVSAALNEGACGSNWNNTSVSGEYIKNKILNPADSWAGSGGNTPPVSNITSPVNNSYYEVGNTVKIDATAYDSDGSVSLVEFYANNEKIGEDNTSPYSINWIPSSANTYTLKTKATDNENATNTSLGVNVNVVVEIIQNPYPDENLPHSIPGEVLAVNYDDGGEGIAYHDTDETNLGVGGIRTNEGVDTEGGDGQGNVGYVVSGEWLEYTVNVSSEATYSLVLRFASAVGGGIFHLEFDGVDKTGPINVGSTGNWDSYQELTVEGIQLEAGKQVMRMAIDNGDFNFSKFTFEGGSEVVPVTGITVSPSTLTLNKNETSTLTATITPQNATNKSVTWNSSNTSIATVSSSGLITAIEPGIVTITGTSSAPDISDNCVLTVTDQTVENYTLTTLTIGTGSIELSPSGGSYAPGTSVTLTAVAGTGYQFSTWSGDATSTSTSVTITMDANKSVTATFTEISGGDCDSPITINLPYEIDGEGNVCLETSDDIDFINSWNADKIEINGMDITNEYQNSFPPKVDGKYTITYTATVGWAHVEIMGSGGTPVTNYTLTSSVNGQGSITPASGTFEEGALVSLSATPADGWLFNGWSGDASGTSRSTTLSMTKDMNVIASFLEDTSSTNPDCSFDIPLSTALPSLNESYKNIHIIGNGPNLSNLGEFTINWALANNGLYQLSVNTNDGSPDWFIDLRSNATQTFNEVNPSLSITGSNIAGLDGNYWVAVDGENFVLVEKTNAYSIYFSNSVTVPCTSFKSVEKSFTSVQNFKVYPNPASDWIHVAELENIKSLKISNILGGVIYTNNNIQSESLYIPISKIKSGSYIISVIGADGLTHSEIVFIK